jgi:hypothetical protein
MGAVVPDGVLAAEVPDLELKVLILDDLHVEADGCVGRGVLGTVCLTSLRCSLSAWGRKY